MGLIEVPWSRILRRYSDDEPRDADGKWTAGGDTPAPYDDATEGSYEISHRPTPGPPINDLYGKTLDGEVMLDESSKVYEHPEWYSGNVNDSNTQETAAALRNARGKDDETLIKIYRSAPAGITTINNGDWVSPSRSYAAANNLAEDPADDMPTYAINVPMKYVRWAGDDLNEFGYFGPSINVSSENTRGVRYDDDEPRDGDGKWTSGSGDEKVATDKSGVYTKGGSNLTYTNYTGKTGNNKHITRREYGTIPTAAITNAKGMMGEDPKTFVGSRWEELKVDIKTNGITNPIFVNVDHGKNPMINEGNHRLEAARQLGMRTVPVEIAYYGHAEDEGTVMDRYWKMTAGRGVRYSPDQPRDPNGEFANGEGSTETGTVTTHDGFRTISATKDYPEVRETSKGASNSGMWQTTLADGRTMNLDVKNNRSGGVTPEIAQHLLGTMATCHNTYDPTGQVPIVKVGATSPGAYATTLAGIHPSSGRDVRETVFSPAALNLGPKFESLNDGVKPGNFMQSFPIHRDDGLRQLDYVAAHEYGHIVQWNSKNVEADAVARRLTIGGAVGQMGLSRYGATAAHEAYAETFADWYMSKGSTTRAATLAVQAAAGWRKP